MNNQWIVLVGTIGDGFKSYGPFNSFEHADRWVQGNTPTTSWEIMKLHHHERHEEKKP